MRLHRPSGSRQHGRVQSLTASVVGRITPRGIVNYQITWTYISDGSRTQGVITSGDWEAAVSLANAKREELLKAGYKKVKTKIHKVESHSRAKKHPDRVSDYTGRERHRTVGSQLKTNWLHNPPDDSGGE